MDKPLTPTIAERAAYIAETCAELYRLTTPHQLMTLGYLVNVTRVEAERLLKLEQAEERRLQRE